MSSPAAPVPDNREELMHRALGATDLLQQTIERLAVQFDATRQTNLSSGQYVNSLQVKSARTRLFGLTGYNAAASALFLQLFDVADHPRDDAIPDVLLALAATEPFALDYGLRGRHFTNGLYIVISTTGPTKTETTTPDVWLDVQYD